MHTHWSHFVPNMSTRHPRTFSSTHHHHQHWPKCTIFAPSSAVSSQPSPDLSAALIGWLSRRRFVCRRLGLNEIYFMCNSILSTEQLRRASLKSGDFLTVQYNFVAKSCCWLVECCFTSRETVRLIRDGSPGRPPTSTFTQLLSSSFYFYFIALV